MALVNRQRRGKPLALATAAAAAVIGLVVGWSAPASANSNVDVNKSGQNVYATSPGVTNECDDNFGGGPYDGFDVWVFNLPGDHAVVGDFVSVTATFNDGQNDIVKTIDTDQPSGIVLKGTSKAWIKMPAGLKLVNATAVITGTADFFTLTHTCPTGYTPPPPTESTPPATTPPGHTPPGTPGTSTTPSLPTTGSSLTGVIIAGLVLVGGGSALLVVARRRRAAN